MEPQKQINQASKPPNNMPDANHPVHLGSQLPSPALAHTLYKERLNLLNPHLISLPEESFSRGVNNSDVIRIQKHHKIRIPQTTQRESTTAGL